MHGLIDSDSQLTFVRLIERLFDRGESGELRLRALHADAEATLQIGRSTIGHAVFGDLTGEPAIQAVKKVEAWEFWFEPARSSLPTAEHPASPSAGAAPVAVARPGLPGLSIKPARIKTSPAPTGPVATTISLTTPGIAVARTTLDGQTPPTTLPTRRAPAVEPLQPAPVDGNPAPDDFRPITAPFPSSQPAADSPPAPTLPDGFSRLVCLNQKLTGGSADEAAFYTTDFAFLRFQAEAIGATLGLSLPTVLALAEPDRATVAYRVHSASSFTAIAAPAGASVEGAVRHL